MSGPVGPAPAPRDTTGATVAREAELAAALAAVERRLVDACRAAGRPRSDVRLVAVTKTWPASDAAAALRLGVADLGEARDGEAATKAEEVAGLLAAEPDTPGPRWHLVGQLQSNKARSVARWASAVHSVDRLSLVPVLDRAAQRAERRVDAFVQVDLDPSRRPGVPTSGALGQRGGAAPEEVLDLCAAVADAAALRLVGLMAVAPRGADPAAAFGRLADLAARVREAHPSATSLSAGMSGDLEEAVAAGATHVRVGTALFGGRPAPPR